jgi:plasmid stabilization system protein ParE
MKYELLVKAEAIQDMTEAFDWYESQQAGLGIKFLDEVAEFYDRISQHPEHYQSHRNQRIAVLHRFPYKIVYEIERESIVVYAVYHDKRNPEKLAERE